ncbi:MAG: hypothetical protein JOS17DRAFT_133249 [Linnemannia elongata]|nr:MAG: hypothetical protein JOS17DRAFT_133249 [Linnemannia elongata]
MSPQSCLGVVLPPFAHFFLSSSQQGSPSQVYPYSFFCSWLLFFFCVQNNNIIQKKKKKRASIGFFSYYFISSLISILYQQPPIIPTLIKSLLKNSFCMNERSNDHPSL